MTDTVVDFASRITMKDLGCNPKDVLKMDRKLPLARIYGQAGRVGYQEDRNSGQQYVFFVGSFEGINLQTGETLQSAKLYLPEGPTQVLENMVHQTQNKRGKNAMVDFAFEIRAIKNEANQIGYSYETVALLKPEHADPLQRVREIVTAAPTPKDTATDKAANPQKKSA